MNLSTCHFQKECDSFHTVKRSLRHLINLRNLLKHNSNHLNWFLTQTNESILIKVSKILIFKYFAYFSAIFGKFSGRSGPFSSSNTTRNNVEHYINNLKRFPGKTSKSTLIEVWKTLISTYFANYLALFDPFGGSNHKYLKFVDQCQKSLISSYFANLSAIFGQM